MADYGNANDNSNNDHFLSANSNKAISALQNTKLGSGLVYEAVPKVRHKNGTVQAENEYKRSNKLLIFLSSA